MQRLWKKPELMSPAGYWPQLKTAIEAGAFQQALAGEMPVEHLEHTLKQLAPQGITEGSLFVPLDYSRVPQLG